MFAFVVLDGFSVSQEIGWEQLLGNDIFCSCVAWFCCVKYSLFSIKPRDWLGRLSPKWPILSRVGCKTLTRSFRHNSGF